MEMCKVFLIKSVLLCTFIKPLNFNEKSLLNIHINEMFKTKMYFSSDASLIDDLYCIGTHLMRSPAALNDPS